MVSVALSTGELLCVLACVLVKLSDCADCSRFGPGATRIAPTRTNQRAIAQLRARETDRRRDWVEKTTTDVARRFDTIRVEDLHIRAMSRSARALSVTQA